MRSSTEVPIVFLVLLTVLAVACSAGLVALRFRHGARLRRIESVRNDLLGRLALVAEFRDHRTRQYAREVARTAASIAERMGLGAADASEIGLAAQFHDIGKVALPESVLRKSGTLTPEERGIVQSHTLMGAELLAGEPGVLTLAAEIALTHHERWDGNGYPHGLRGTEIPVAGRIVAVADAFHALVAPRPPTRAWPVEMAVAEVERSAGRQFDPAVVDAFGSLPHHALAARARDGDEPPGYAAPTSSGSSL